MESSFPEQGIPTSKSDASQQICEVTSLGLLHWLPAVQDMSTPHVARQKWVATFYYSARQLSKRGWQHAQRPQVQYHQHKGPCFTHCLGCHAMWVHATIITPRKQPDTSRTLAELASSAGDRYQVRHACSLTLPSSICTTVKLRSRSISWRTNKTCHSTATALACSLRHHLSQQHVPFLIQLAN